MKNRVPCTECGTAILEVTAKWNGGLCGPCVRSLEPAPPEHVDTISAEDFAEAVRIVWRLLSEEVGLPDNSIRLGLDLSKLLKKDDSLKGRLLRGVESATGGRFLDGLWQSRHFSMTDLVDFCARMVNNMREHNNALPTDGASAERHPRR